LVVSYAASEQWPTFGGNLLNPFGRPGVFFFSLEAASLPAVLGARAADKLPYLHAAMVIRSDGREFHYSSSRLQSPGRPTFTRDTSLSLRPGSGKRTRLNSS